MSIGIRCDGKELIIYIIKFKFESGHASLVKLLVYMCHNLIFYQTIFIDVKISNKIHIFSLQLI